MVPARGMATDPNALAADVAFALMRLTETFKDVFPADVLKRYEMREVRSAAAVLAHTTPDEFAELVEILSDFALTKADILNPGKNEGQAPSA
jgi:hypothetical protein